jgi:hypothetical protein
MVEPLRHRRTKGAATDMFYLTPPRHISTLPCVTSITGPHGVNVRSASNRRSGSPKSAVELQARSLPSVRARPARVEERPLLAETRIREDPNKLAFGYEWLHLTRSSGPRQSAATCVQANRACLRNHVLKTFTVRINFYSYIVRALWHGVQHSRELNLRPVKVADGNRTGISLSCAQI